MKKLLTAVAAVTLIAILPAQATTFSLRTIYVATGVTDNGGADNAGAATSVHCTNLSGKTAQMKMSFFNSAGALVGFDAGSLAHLATLTVSSHGVQYFADAALGTGAIGQGVVNIQSTESGIFCTAMIVGAAGAIPNGIPLHMVRFNPHPGTVE